MPAQDQGDSLRLLGPSAWWGQSGAGWAEPGRVVVPKSRDPGRCLAKETVLVGGTGCLGPADPALGLGGNKIQWEKNAVY